MPSMFSKPMTFDAKNRSSSFMWISRVLLLDVISSAQTPVTILLLKTVNMFKAFYVVSPLRRLRVAMRSVMAVVSGATCVSFPGLWLGEMVSKISGSNSEMSNLLQEEDSDAISLDLDSLNWNANSGPVSYPEKEFEYLKLIGQGAFGTVILCRSRRSSKLYAMKVISKKTVRKLRRVEHALAERRILELSHPFMVRMHCSFETVNHLNIALEYCPGGDMFSLLDRYGRFSESMTQFYAGAVFLAINHLHSNNIIYRDLKPENILIDKEGFPKLTDFGLAKIGMSGDVRAKSFCGSDDYLAPEVIIGGGYDYAADLWSLGCLVYEMLTGFPPFYSGKDKNSRYEKIKLGRCSYPSYLSREACSLISGLLTVDPRQRLGNGPRGAKEITSHPFFKDVDWYLLVTKQQRPPFEPSLDGCLDVSHFGVQVTSASNDKDLFSELAKENIVRTDDEFAGFDWNIS